MNVALAAPNVGVVTLYANVFLLNSAHGRLLVDTGTVPYLTRFRDLLNAFQPDAVLVTHSHLDHAGNAFLAARAGYPVLTHPLEFDRLSGQTHALPYPAGQPRIAEILARLHPKVTPAQLTPVEAGADILGWEVVHLPGHTEGQIGLRQHGLLIAADAVVSTGSAAHLPKPAYNWNHGLALQTLKNMADMHLQVILPSHGTALTPQQIKARAERDG